MPKLLVRIVLLLLVPCLIADPVTASALINPLSPLGCERSPEVRRLAGSSGEVGVSGDIICFQDQALMLPMTFGPQVLEHISRIWRSASGLVHSVLGGTKEPADASAAAPPRARPPETVRIP